VVRTYLELAQNFLLLRISEEKAVVKPGQNRLLVWFVYVVYSGLHQLKKSLPKDDSLKVVV